MRNVYIIYTSLTDNKIYLKTYLINILNTFDFSVFSTLNENYLNINENVN